MCRNAASFESNALSAAWAQRQLEPRASRIHDETDTARYIRGSIGFLCLVEMEALGTRPKVARKREPVAHSAITNERTTGLFPRAAIIVTSAQT